MRRLSLLLLLGACASAGGGTSNPGDGPNGGGGDGGNPGDPDAAIDAVPPDAPPMPLTLSQNTSTTVTGGSFSCNQTPGSFTRENSYYRVFALADHGVTAQFDVTSVTFAVETATAGGAAVAQAAQLKLGLYTGLAGGGSIDPAMITPLASLAIQIPDAAAAAMVNTPIAASVPAGGSLVVELAIPDGAAAQNVFFIGTNAAGEAKPAYIRSPTCNITVPTGMNQIATGAGLGKADAIITVAGLKY